MQRRIGRVLVLAAALFCTHCAWAQTATPLVRFRPLNSDVTLDPNLCKPTSSIPPHSHQCVITVTMTWDSTSCTASIAGTLEFETGKVKPRVVWELSPSQDDAKNKFEFHPDYGILIVDDPGKQMKDENKKGGGPGDGTTVTTDHFFWDHKSDKKNTITYLPIVLRRIGSESTACGSRDPLIVNKP